MPQINEIPSGSGFDSLDPLAPCLIDMDSPMVPITSMEPICTSNSTALQEPSLKVVPRKKSIFLSRLDPETSEAQLKSYIETKVQNVSNFIIKKFNFRYSRDVASFKIIPDDNAYNILIDRNFWPKGTVVHEFVERPRRVPNPVSLPKINVSSPKN